MTVMFLWMCSEIKENNLSKIKHELEIAKVVWQTVVQHITSGATTLQLFTIANKQIEELSHKINGRMSVEQIEELSHRIKKNFGNKGE